MSVKFFPVILFALFAFASCGEPKSKDRFTSTCGLELPADVVVLKDERVEAGKDYGIQYTVRLIPKEMKECTDKIRSSTLFSPSGTQENNKWIKAGNGYHFYLAKEGIYYSVEVDTVTGVVNYVEQG